MGVWYASWSFYQAAKRGIKANWRLGPLPDSLSTPLTMMPKPENRTLITGIPISNFPDDFLDFLFHLLPSKFSMGKFNYIIQLFTTH